MNEFHYAIRTGIPDTLPPMPYIDPKMNRAPKRRNILHIHEKVQAVQNALRYFPEQLHEQLAPEFAKELEDFGRIYMLRYRPAYEMKARPISEYPAQSIQAAAIMLMIQNNLDPQVAQHPYELVTYGGNGAVFQNWAQYLLTMQYLSTMSDEQTLVMYSGHPLGLFPSHEDAPRVVITNGLMIPHYSSQDDYDRYNALGVTSYGQMTAGSYMYIGPQGIVHGTAITLLNAGRKYLQTSENLAGKLFVTSGLGGMSGAQPKAAVIAGAVCIVAEINPKALETRHSQGWLMEYETDLDKLVSKAQHAQKNKEALSIGYLGNIVDLLEYLAEKDIPVDLGSDQTSLHNPFGGGYYPVDLSFEEANALISSDPEKFKGLVYQSLRRHVAAINKLSEHGMYFWDYGNAFLLEASRAGAQGILDSHGNFTYPSYVEDIMGPMCFDYGFGPFRWVCTSNNPKDLEQTDQIASSILEEASKSAPPEIKQQMQDNALWINSAQQNKLVVGSQARILYADHERRMAIAEAFNNAINKGTISAPIVLGRDHHDVSGTDSPYRETANIRDGSRFTADMAVHNFIGDSFRGATWVSLHNGGGVGWGEVMNGGFGLLLDGSQAASQRAAHMLDWDVSNGLARRSWAGNDHAQFAIKRAMEKSPTMQVTLPHATNHHVLSSIEHLFK